MNMVFQWSMYYLSFAPLWLSVIFLDVMSLVHGTTCPWVERISIVIIPVVLIIALYFMKAGLKPSITEAQKYYIEEVEEEKFLTAEFLFTYIFPLFAFDFTTWEGMTLFAVFFIIFGLLCHRHNYFCTNVMLDALGYRIYSCELVDSSDVSVTYKVISKRYLRTQQGEEILLQQLNNDYSLDCKYNPYLHSVANS